MTPDKIKEFFARMKRENPEPKCELNYTTPFTLLVAIVLSAQTTDKNVNKATPELFKIADTPEKMAALGEEKLKAYIRSIGLFNTKAKNVIALSKELIEKYGGNRMYFAPPIDYDKVMKLIPYGKVITVGKIREYFAELNGADFTEPITAGIFVSIAAWASYQRSEDETPYWRTLKANGELNPNYPGGIEAQKEKRIVRI